MKVPLTRRFSFKSIKHNLTFRPIISQPNLFSHRWSLRITRLNYRLLIGFIPFPIVQDVIFKRIKVIHKSIHLSFKAFKKPSVASKLRMSSFLIVCV